MSTTKTPMPRQQSRRRWLVALGVLISIVFLVIAFRGLQPGAFMESLAAVNLPLLGVAALSYFAAVTVIAWRWQFLLRAFQYVPLTALTRIVAIGYMGNNVYPLRAGEALRIGLLSRDYEIPVAQSATTVAVERVFDGLVMLSFVLGGLLLVDVQSPQIDLVASVAAPVFGVALLLFIVLAAFPNVLAGLVERISGVLPERIGAILLSLSEDILSGLAGLRSPLHLLGAVVTSFATWAIEAGVYWLVLIAFDLPSGYPVALLVVGTVNLAGLIPASPGQVGVYEFFASSVLMGVGIAQDTALAYAIVVHLVIWLPVTLAGFGFLVRRGLGWTDIRKARELENRSSAESD
jgi:hypothetical protein